MSEKVVQKQKVKGNTKSGAPAAASSSSSSSSTAQKARVGGVELDDRVKRILEVRKVVKERDQARADGDFGKSDILREQLAARYNVELIDQKGGPSGWKFKDGTSHKLPAGINLPEPVTGQKRSRDEPQSNGSNSAREGSGEKKKVKINPQQAPAAAKPKPG